MDRRLFFGALAAGVTLAVFLMLGAPGLSTTLAIGLIFVLPATLLLDCLPFSLSEKLLFGFFLGIALVGSLTYYLGFLLGLRLALGVVWVLAMACALWLRRCARRSPQHR